MLNFNSDENIMYFVNDDDFAKFCINPDIQVFTKIDANGNEIMLADYDFTPAYRDALAMGTRFCIKDLSSHVNKDGILGYRNTSKQIENIERYYGED